MARRSRRSGVFDDLLEIATKLPWKASAVLAVVSFLVFHWISGVDVGTASDTKALGSVVAKQIFRMVGLIGQFVAPLAFIAGAIVSFRKQGRRTELVASVASSKATDPLNDMSWHEFESLVEEAYRLRGYTVRRVGGDGPDGGVDLVLDHGAEKVLVQCKQWRAMKVGVSTIRELYGVMAAKGAASGIVVTSGQFTAEAIEFASGRNVELVEGGELRRMIRGAKGSHVAASARDPVPLIQAATGCPKCGSPMVKRAAKRGANAGQEFYGCTKYPTCRGTRPAA